MIKLDFSFICILYMEVCKRFHHFLKKVARNYEDDRNPIVSKLIRVILCSHEFYVSVTYIARLQYVMCIDCL